MAEELLTLQKEGASLFILCHVCSLLVGLILSWDELPHLHGSGSFVQVVLHSSFKICLTGSEAV